MFGFNLLLPLAYILLILDNICYFSVAVLNKPLQVLANFLLLLTSFF